MTTKLAIIGRERALIDKLAKAIHGAMRGHESTDVRTTDRGAYFDVRVFDGPEPSGRIARVKVELDRLDNEAESNYHLWVNEERTTLVRMWDSGVVEVATREHSSHTWGPPVTLAEERV